MPKRDKLTNPAWHNPDGGRIEADDPNNPLGFLYGTMGILVICTITHFYTVSHLTCLTALKQLDPDHRSSKSCWLPPVDCQCHRLVILIAFTQVTFCSNQRSPHSTQQS